MYGWPIWPCIGCLSTVITRAHLFKPLPGPNCPAGPIWDLFRLPFDDDNDQGKRKIMIIMMVMMMMMVTQQIPTRHIPTRWEYVIMNRGGNVTLSYSHHIYIHHYHYG